MYEDIMEMLDREADGSDSLEVGGRMGFVVRVLANWHRVS